jgi:hypothetical protein
LAPIVSDEHSHDITPIIDGHLPYESITMQCGPLASDDVYRTIMKIPAGTTCYIGPPARPIPKQTSDAIGTTLGKIPEIVEAHLPMVFIEGQIDPPAQVLVVVLEGNRSSSQARISEVLSGVLPTDSHMDVMESHPGDPNLPTIRATGTQLDLNRKPN